MAGIHATPRRLPTLLLAWFCAAMLGLATGAAWWMIATYARGLPSAWLALPAGWLLGLAMRHWIWPRSITAAVMAGLATLLAAAYMAILLAALRIGGQFGINILEVLRSAGGSLLTNAALLALTPGDCVWFIVGAALAAWAAWRPPRRG